ncbi:hypothetical protein SAMN04488700_2392 [Carnobacterium iners]|uniref:Competence protein ComGG n=1 Tax=Carnobacterium iners TaxID=1073423 RepID=A0A1X7NR66_9LACT|nr:hypothetical protein [Carnobacterium iners]SEL16110.1 hypothetical protein SAMN04488114_13110 [Carnobacterium iners]SMH40587.1 hypothetical protein SAMN04488700_2392 [Carnobacterium iners]
MNQKGTILPSVVIFVFLIATVMIGTARIYKNQMQQMILTENYYLIHTMIALSKVEVQRKLAESSTFKKAVFNFEDGKVEVYKEKEESYIFIGTTKNNPTNSIKVNVSFLNDKEFNGKTDEKKEIEKSETEKSYELLKSK